MCIYVSDFMSYDSFSLRSLLSYEICYLFLWNSDFLAYF